MDHLGYRKSRKNDSQQHPVGHVCFQPAWLATTTRCSHTSRALYHKLPLSSRLEAVDVGAVGPKKYTIIKSGPVFVFRCLGWLCLRSSNRESLNGTHVFWGHQTSCNVAGHFEGTNGNRQGSVVFKLLRTPRNRWQARFQNL